MYNFKFKLILKNFNQEKRCSGWSNPPTKTSNFSRSGVAEGSRGASSSPIWWKSATWWDWIQVTRSWSLPGGSTRSTLPLTPSCSAETSSIRSLLRCSWRSSRSNKGSGWTLKVGFLLSHLCRGASWTGVWSLQRFNPFISLLCLYFHGICISILCSIKNFL